MIILQQINKLVRRMIASISRNRIHRSLLTIIGVYQIIGALLGLYGLIIFSNYLVVLPLSFILFLSVYLFGSYCGWLLLKSDKSQGIKNSLINQVLQLVQFKIFVFGFKYVSGFYVGLGLKLSPNVKLNLDFAVFESILSYTYKGTDELFFFINLIALFFVFLLLVLKESSSYKPIHSDVILPTNTL